MKKFLFVCLVSIPLYSIAQDSAAVISPQPPPPVAEKIVLTEGTEISVALVKDISGKTAKEGEHVDFTLSEDFILNDSIVIAKGAKVIGTVTESDGSKMLGKKGKLEFSIDYLYLPNNKVVKLRSTIEANTKGRGATVAVGAVLLTPIALFIKGKQATYDKGTVFKVYIDKDTAIN